MYGVRGRFIAYTSSTQHGETRLSRNELRRGRRTRGPYDKIIESKWVNYYKPLISLSAPIQNAQEL